MIRVLSTDVAAKIAAGEVIERPASVVKELVENAIDAGASRIDVDIAGGGVDHILVADDGVGIPSAEVGLAFQRHATSKLTSVEDLARVTTLGFRGEALPSIAAVADVCMVTRHASEAMGTEVLVSGGRVLSQEPAAREPGTTITVRDLFARLPVRRKFLRSRSAETSQVVQWVSQFCLAYPSIRFSLKSEGRELLGTAGRGDLRDAVAEVLGPEVARHMVPAEESLGPEVDGRTEVRVRVSGLVGDPSLHRPSRAGISIFVNGRWVRNRSLSHAVEEAYSTLVPTGRFPVVVLDVRVPPEDLDVNVHPQKTEIKFLRESLVYRCVQMAIRSALRSVVGFRWESDSSLDEDLRYGRGLARGADEGLVVLGQAARTYIIAEGNAGLYLIDQHAAHERVLLEQLRASMARQDSSQLLLQPAVVELDLRQASALADRLDDLRALGYMVEEFGPRSLLVRGVPAALAERDPLKALCEAADALADETSQQDWRERLSVLLSCKTAIRAGDVLSVEEMRALIGRLREAELCDTCSHGRPTAILLTHSQLEKEFGRR